MLCCDFWNCGCGEREASGNETSADLCGICLTFLGQAFAALIFFVFSSAAIGLCAIVEFSDGYRNRMLL